MGNVLPAGAISNLYLRPCRKTSYNYPGSFQPEDREPGRIYPAKGNGIRILSTNLTYYTKAGSIENWKWEIGNRIDSPCHLYNVQILEVLLPQNCNYLAACLRCGRLRTCSRTAVRQSPGPPAGMQAPGMSGRIRVDP